ncbi:preprotein translocase subunit SecE [Clostridium botulinum]|uniref:Protein translocase subunit SecE n=1 Tax=Clostridium botulinum TaxID=1491 RepID=A0A0C2S620_CLOBO|nr:MULTISPECIES: preprotein translocase subunit SecE [Clostridium]ACD52273.1 preprotein translocase, SecE subunit [Clostridium botulinum E3 str. Alaska E43]AJF28316.1 preprotein translocase subunit SecE [Clostridium botulinum]AJF31376.1 preprotein translocase subunit SecE [Clostridium botulinum]EES51071.1 preprotein translocase, SecE subunit [Clostridium botulinum E1 str. 'BoNT E Beluga']KAI3344591.1 preprotein translocase subunit SecE [Clostridium botulinum]
MSVKDIAKTKDAPKNSGLLSFFREVKAEFKIITWPSKDETKKAFVAVGVFAIIYIILVGGLDFIFKNLFEMIFNFK